jgi:hypothetical protein
MNQERGAGLALERQTGTTLLTSFFRAGRGRGKKTCEKPGENCSLY